MHYRFQVYLFILTQLCQSLAYSQVISEPLSSGKLELGYSHHWYKGAFYYESENSSSAEIRSNGTIYFRAGVFDMVTVLAEGMVWPVSSESNYPGESFLNYTFGLALSSRSIVLLDFDIFLHIYYLDNLYLDRSDSKNDKQFRDLLLALPVRYHFLKKYSIWFAPVYSWNDAAYFEDQTYTRSNKSGGVSFGFDALFYEHVYLNLGFTYIEYFLPGISAGFRF
jgi:hypothetical protein